MEQTQADKYKNMYWAMEKKCEKLKKEIDELIIENNIIKRTLYTGKICHINYHNSYGKINNNETELYFHRTSCNFKLSQTMLNKSVKFNICMDNTSGKPKAINITYKPDDIYSKYVKESGFTQEELNVDEQVNEPKLEPNINKFGELGQCICRRWGKGYGVRCDTKNEYEGGYCKFHNKQFEDRGGIGCGIWGSERPTFWVFGSASNKDKKCGWKNTFEEEQNLI